MTPTGEIFMKFDNDNFYKNLSMNSDVSDYKKKPETLHDYLCTFLITSQYVTQMVFFMRHKFRPQKEWIVNLMKDIGKTYNVLCKACKGTLKIPAF
jgi:hypothetical protein